MISKYIKWISVIKYPFLGVTYLYYKYILVKIKFYFAIHNTWESPAYSQ